VTDAVGGAGGDSSITYAEIHSELEEVRRILVDLTGTVERLSSIVSSVRPQHAAPVPATMASPASPTAVPVASAPEIPPSTSPVAANPVDAILGDAFGRPT
jgi:hypothetical protein